MTTCVCCSGEAKYFAKYRNRNREVRRFRCIRCGKTFSESQPLDGLRIETAKLHQVVQLLCEGVGIRAVSRLTGLNKETVLHILTTVGEKCASFHDAAVRNVKVANVETDELYSKVFCKQERNRTADPERGEQYCHRSLQNQPVGVESKPATLRRGFHNRFMDKCKGCLFWNQAGRFSTPTLVPPKAFEVRNDQGELRR